VIAASVGGLFHFKRNVAYWQILLQKSAILVVGLPLRPLEADSDYSFSHWTLVGV